MPLMLVLNGQTRTFPTLAPATTLDHLVSALGLQGDRVAVELNGDIVARAAWGQTPLAEGDRLEVVHFVGGGSSTSR